MNKTSDMMKMSFPLDKVALERIDTLLTLADAKLEKQESFIKILLI